MFVCYVYNGIELSLFATNTHEMCTQNFVYMYCIHTYFGAVDRQKQTHTHTGTDNKQTSQKEYSKRLFIRNKQRTRGKENFFNLIRTFF